MKKLLVLLLSTNLGFVVAARADEKAVRKIADVGDGKLLSCRKGNTSFEIFKTAAPNLFEGQLQLSGNAGVALKCTRLDQKPSSHYVIWDCEEMRAGDGLLSVIVDTGGATGATIATISQAQMYPLHAKVLQSVNCQH